MLSVLSVIDWSAWMMAVRMLANGFGSRGNPCVPVMVTGMPGRYGVARVRVFAYFVSGVSPSVLVYSMVYSEVTSVRSTYDTSLEYTIDYAKSDGCTPETKYTNTLTLNTPYLPGMPVTITGTHGFNRLPKPLSGILTAIIQADQSMTDQSDRITSKKIEDVSVTYATSTQTTLEHALAPYKALLDTWRLCPANPDAGGFLSMPTPHYDSPWWMNTQDYQGGDYTYDTAM